MATRTLRIAMEGVTGRLGTNQHLIRSILAIRKEGGLPLRNGDRLMPEPVLLGRNPEKLAALAAAHGGARLVGRRRRDARRRNRRHLFRHVSDRRTARACAARDRGRQARLPGEADRRTSCASREWRSCAPRRPPAVKAASVQDKVYLPGLPQAHKACRDFWLLRLHPVGAARQRLVGVRRPRSIPRSARAGTTGRRTAAALVLDMYPHWRYPADQPDRADQGRVVPHGDADPSAA